MSKNITIKRVPEPVSFTDGEWSYMAVLKNGGKVKIHDVIKTVDGFQRVVGTGQKSLVVLKCEPDGKTYDFLTKLIPRHRYMVITSAKKN